jgi:hypothetical protein
MISGRAKVQVSRVYATQIWQIWIQQDTGRALTTTPTSRSLGTK